MKKKVLLLFVVLLFGCGPNPRTYLDFQHAERFVPCPSDNIENPQQHAFVALQASLTEEDWVIEKLESEKFEVVARKCRSPHRGDYLELPDRLCSSVKFMVKSNAEIYAIFAKSNENHRRRAMVHQTYRWMETLERNYAEFRCYSEEKLAERTPVGRGR